MVVVTFENNIDSTNVDLYRSLFTNVVNPNGCPGRGSFYIEDDGTDYDIVKNLYDSKFEIGIHSLDGTTPKDNNAWIKMYKGEIYIFRFLSTVKPLLSDHIKKEYFWIFRLVVAYCCMKDNKKK